MEHSDEKSWVFIQNVSTFQFEGIIFKTSAII